MADFFGTQKLVLKHRATRKEMLGTFMLLVGGVSSCLYVFDITTLSEHGPAFLTASICVAVLGLFLMLKGRGQYRYGYEQVIGAGTVVDHIHRHGSHFLVVRGVNRVLEEIIEHVRVDELIYYRTADDETYVVRYPSVR
jgi:hypothetical protein